MEILDHHDFIYIFFKHSPKWGPRVNNLARSRAAAGDTLSPILFILVMEALTLLFEKAEGEGILSAFQDHQAFPQRLTVYADDVIMFL